MVDPSSPDADAPNPARPSILFVCLGNICRSPAGEGLLRDLVRRRGLDDRIEIDSAGTNGLHDGDPPDPRMTAAARDRGVSLEGASRQIEPADFRRFDRIVAMDRRNLADLGRVPGFDRDRVRLLSDYLSDPDKGRFGLEVPDPYYGGAAGFERVLDMIEAAREAILDEALDAAANALEDD